MPIRSTLLAVFLAFPGVLMARDLSQNPDFEMPQRPVRVPGAAQTAPETTPLAAPSITPMPVATPVPTPIPAEATALPVPASPTPRSIPSAPSTTRRRVEPPAADEMIQSIDFPNTDISEVLGFYEQLTGKKVLYDSTVQGKIRIRVLKPISRMEAIRIVETAIALNNFTLIQGPGDIVKVINATKNPRQFGIPILSDVCQLPESNQVVSFLFKLDYADPQEVKTTLDQVVAITPQITSIVALPKSQAVLVTETADVIRNVARIVAQIDSKPAEVVSEFFQLQRADAKDVVERLTKMFEKTPGPGSSGSVPAPPGVPQPANATGPITLSEDALIVGKIKIDADLRTNRIQVVTRPVNLPFLRTLISELDSSIPLGEPNTRPLRFVLAGDVLDIVAGAVAEPGVKVERLESSGRAGSNAANPVVNTTGNLGTSYDNSSRGSSSRSGYQRGGGGSGLTPGAFGSQNAAQQADTAPEGRIIHNTKIIADNRINAIIVIGNDEVKRKVFKLLDQIDVRAPQVMLTAVIGELTLNNDEEFGIDYLFNKGNLGSLLAASGSAVISGSGLGALPVSVPSLYNGASLSGIVSAESLPGSSGVTGLIGATHSFDIILNALESTGRFRVTSRPMIFTSNNRPAVISSGESIPVPSSINSSYGYGTTGNGLVTTANVDFIDVALKLSVLPLINSEGEVTLKITQEANNTSGSTVIGGNSIPTVTTRSIDTTVSVANEATVVLGGLVSEQTQTTKGGIPVLYRLPIIGPLFGSTKKTLQRTELIVLIRPTVTNGPVEAIRAGEKAMEKTNFAPDLEATLDPPSTRVNKDEPKKFAIPKAFLRPEE